MLFDHLGYSFFRGGLTISRAGFLVEREIWLGFPRDTDAGILLRILADEAFVGDKPTGMSNPPSSTRSGISTTSSLFTPATGSSRDRGRFTQPHSVT